MPRGRPQPTIIREKDGFAILEGKHIYYITYENEPINIRKVYGVNRYLRTGSPNTAHLVRTAEKMNKLFNTDKFKVFKIEKGRPI